MMSLFTATVIEYMTTDDSASSEKIMASLQLRHRMCGNNPGNHIL